MKNADLPAMPMFSVDAKPGMVRVKGGDKSDSVATAGLTKREMFAMHAMQGILSNSGGVIQANSMSGTGWCNCDASGFAQWSLECADSLLAELEK